MTSLGALKSVLSRARLVVANDSAPLHIAIAMGATVVGIFGPTTKELGFFPKAPPGKSATAELAELNCRPCGLHGHNACPLGHFRCMLDLKPEAVLKEAESLLCQ
jgi:heptosyltransferase-2